MATVISNEYDHIDIVNGSNTNRHFIKDTTARNDIVDLKSAIDGVTEVLNYFHVNDQTVNNKTVVNVDNGIKFNGAVGDADAYFELGTLEPGTYTAALNILSGTISSNSALSLRYGTGSGTRWVNSSNLTVTITFQEETRIFINISKLTTVEDYIVQFQISKGETAGDYSAKPLNAVDQYARDRLIELNSTLTESGKAADAEAAGDAIREVADDLANTKADIYDAPIYHVNRLMIEQGAFNDNFGKSNDSKRIRVSQYFRVVNGAKLFFDIGTLYYHINLFAPDKTHISNSGWMNDSVYTVDFGTNEYGYIGIAFANDATYSASTAITADDFLPEYSVSIDYSANLSIAVAGLQASVNALNVETGKLPDYWETAIAAKINAMLPFYADAQMDGDAFIFLTDYHYNPTRPTQTNNGWSHLLVKRIMRELPIKMFVFGGDAINGNADKEVALQQLEEVSRRFGEEYVYGVRGNHDLNLNDYTLDPEDPTAQQVSDSSYYAFFTKDVEDKIVLASSAFSSESDKQKVCLDYYHDNTVQKIRYIFIDTKHEDSTYGNVTATQIQWMQARIQELTSEWSVIVFAHQYFKDITVTPPTYRQAHKIYDGIKAVLDTAACTIIGVVTGHIHEDFSYTANGFLEIATTTDSMQIGNTTKNPGYAVGTAGEQAFDVFVLDKANRKLKAFRVGHGHDREWTY